MLNIIKTTAHMNYVTKVITLSHETQDDDGLFGGFVYENLEPTKNNVRKYINQLIDSNYPNKISGDLPF